MKSKAKWKLKPTGPRKKMKFNMKTKNRIKNEKKQQQKDEKLKKELKERSEERYWNEKIKIRKIKRA